jgi:DNA-binding transcriptional LysR family regulator
MNMPRPASSVVAQRWLEDAFVFEDAYIEHYRLSPRTGLAGENEKHLSIFGKTMADLNALVIFAKVVEANSFSEAARRLDLPASTVSRRIAELEDQLGVRLLKRSTRSLSLTEIGSQVLEQAQRGAEVSEAVDSLVSYQLTSVSGTLRLAAPPSISDSLLAPLLGTFQASYPNVRIDVFITDRIVDQFAEGVDLAFRVGLRIDASMVAQRLLVYRHQLMASPAYLKSVRLPQNPQDLLGHRLLAFSFREPVRRWHFVHENKRDRETLTFSPNLAMNDYAGLAAALLAGAGIGDLPPLVQPELLRSGRLVEVMPRWRFRNFDLSLVHVKDRHIPRPMRLFKELAATMVPKMFPRLPA